MHAERYQAAKGGDVIAVGVGAFRVERILMGPPRFLAQIEVVRETRCQWVDQDGFRYWKSGGACAGYVNRYLMVPDEYVKAGGVL
jgi:hypothetical protein